MKDVFVLLCLPLCFGVVLQPIQHLIEVDNSSIEVDNIRRRQQPRKQCMVNTAEFDGDRLNNPIFGGGGFVGRLTLNQCRARCVRSVDSHGRRCVAIEWSDGGRTLGAYARRNCALAWGCDYVNGWNGGSVYQIRIWDPQQPQKQCTVNTAEFPDDRLDNPIFGGGGFVGQLTLAQCRAQCRRSLDSRGRSCVAIEWSDGGQTLDADALRNCALAWGCDYVNRWNDGSVYQMRLVS